MFAVTVNPKVENSISIKEVPVPTMNAGEVLIQLKSAALNHRDIFINRSPSWASDWKELIAGGDGAGVIIDMAPDVTEWQIGDEVMLNPFIEEDEASLKFLGGPSDGTFAQFLNVPANKLFKKPSYLTFEEAAAIPLALSTAWGTVVTQGKIKEGETVLIQGIGGGVALFCLQLAVAKGAKVYVTSGSDEKIKEAIKLGALAGVNYKTEDVIERVLELTNQRGVDVAIDSNGKESIHKSAKIIAEGGRLLVFGSTTGSIGKEIPALSYYVETGMVTHEELEDALQFYFQHKMKPMISERRFTLSTIKEAYLELSEAKQFGKVVINIEGEQ
ncbi:zinc-binding dehydrogenase [Bacillus sp. 31A1R]|uniref:Zinc-binding dehydrogenase n=1 Tax=Robertmurraya mangrovi TaxID=3098077 RepID=A0ABU5J0T5_9BACI|nr:zinc-binding dehydrogenase [Bacillus sp. 31A1R]MDZ5473004.1 zinc-binding dehydrogenase [Bacillus sp. 31A1R]